MTTAEAYEIAAHWHDKHARGCKEIADDELRVWVVIAENARLAGRHHAASAAGLRNAAIQLRHTQARNSQKAA